MSRGPDAATLLERRLVAAAAEAGCTITVATLDSERWASATFTGARHRVTLTGGSDDAVAAWLATLPDAELPLRGHLIADLLLARLVRRDGGIAAALEVLTVEEA